MRGGEGGRQLLFYVITSTTQEKYFRSEGLQFKIVQFDLL